MAAFIYNAAKKKILDGLLDLDVGGDDIRVLLLESAAAEDPDHADVAAVVAADTELATYTRMAASMTNLATTEDDTEEEAEFDADNVVFSAVVAQNDIVAYVVYEFITDDDSSVPILFEDGAAGLPLTPNGSDVTIAWDAEGILKLADA